VPHFLKAEFQMTATGEKVSEGRDHWMVIGRIGGWKRIKGKWLLIFFSC
jgi:hypothetical protein